MAISAKGGNVLKNMAVYLTSSLVNKAVPFLLLPVLTKYLSPSEYGKIALLQVTFALILAGIGMSLNSHVTRAYYGYSLERFRQYLTATLLVLSVVLVVGLFVFMSIFLIFGDVLGFGAQWFFLLPIAACMSMSNLIYLTLLRAQNRALSYAGWEFVATISNLLLSVWLVVYVGKGWEGRAAGIIYPLVPVGLVAFLLMWHKKYLVGNIRKGDVLEIFRISMPLIPHAVASVAITLVDRYFVNYYLGASVVGVYSVALQFGMVVMIFSDSFAKAWQPFFFRGMSDGGIESREKIVKYSCLYMVFIFLMAIAYGVIATWLYPYVVTDSRYVLAGALILPAALVYVPYAAYQLAFLYLVYLKKTGMLAFTTVASAFLAVVANLLFVPVFGVVGGFYATGSAYLLNFILIHRIASNHINMPWRTIIIRKT